MDEHNVHHFWGISPALDLGSLLPHCGKGGEGLQVDQPVRFLQVAPYDARHTLTTICRATRHPLLQCQQQPITLTVWEDSPEGLARHLLLLAVALDGSLPPRQRVELLLELHGNAVVRERAAAYLDEKARQLEGLIVGLTGGGVRGGGAGVAASGEDEESRGLRALALMLDLSLLKYQEKDLLVETLQKWRTSVSYDMIKAWDARARKWYGDRYDFRRNLVDWDYHMRLQQAGTPGQDPAAGSVIHFHHFRHWRMHGVAHELRDSHYNQANRSLLSTAYGRTREFKDRSGRDVGRSVSAWGYWADILNGPYQCFGTLTDEPSFYKVVNKQFSRTAVDVAEHNLIALLHEMRTGEPLTLTQGSEAPRAKVARGPTSLEDLAQTSAAAANADASNTAAGDPETTTAPPPTEPNAAVVDGSAASASAVGGAAAAGAVTHEAATASPKADSASTSKNHNTAEPVAPAPAPPPLAADEMPTYSSGGRAQVTRALANAAAAAAQQQPQTSSATGADGTVEGGPEDGGGGHAKAAEGADTGDGGAAAGAGGADVGPSTISDPARQQMAAEEAALREEEARADAAGRQRATRFRLQLVTGDLAKAVTGRAKFAGAFAALTLGHRHLHLLGGEPEGCQLRRVAAPGAQVVVENARHVLQLNKEQAALFVTRMDELAAAGGWHKVAVRPEGVTEACEVYEASGAAM